MSNEERKATFLDILPDLSDVTLSLPKAVTAAESLQPIAPAVAKEILEQEIAALPEHQMLMQYRHYRVYYGSAQQLPRMLDEIARCRELTFRELKEGSGASEDRDRFDETYLHLFAWDTEARQLVGAYRLGRTDELRKEGGNDAVYLAQMFDFAESFYDGPPTLEIGRSFVVPAYQRSHHSLFLLWCGISRYLLKHPRYRQLYGVVSMSRLYDVRAMAVMRDVLLEPRDDVRAEAPYEPDLGDSWQSYLNERRPFTMKDLSDMVKVLEGDLRDVPVLIRHYHKLGATFHAAAVDANFNNTPGLLLRLHVPSIPAKYMKTYFGDGWEGYLAYDASD